MVDIHSHILWGLDDGATSVEASLEMLRIAAGSGTTDIVATPHVNAEFEYAPERNAERTAELTARSGGRPAIHRGCEFHLNYDNVADALQFPTRYSINGHRYLLVECPELQVGASIDGALRQLLDAGLTPIVTHPERNAVLRDKPEKIEAWVDQGCLVQMTALSLTGQLGKSAQSSAHRLLSRGMVHVIASDAHDPVHRHPRLDQAFTLVSDRYGAETADLVFRDNPRRIITGEFVAAGPVLVSRGTGKWWRFGR